MTPEERRHIANRLIAMQHHLRDVFEACDGQFDVCKSAGALRLAFSIAMMKESVVAYSKALNDFTMRFLAEEPLEDENAFDCH